jgi:hypothetical protein
VFTARYELSPYITQTHLIFKGITERTRQIYSYGLRIYSTFLKTVSALLLRVLLETLDTYWVTRSLNYVKLYNAGLGVSV